MKNLWKAFKLNFNGMNDFRFPALPGCCGNAKRWNHPAVGREDRRMGS